MAQMKIKRQPKVESIGNRELHQPTRLRSIRSFAGSVEAHSGGWRARIWLNKKNQRGPTRRHRAQAEHDLRMLQSGVPIRQLSSVPIWAFVEQHGISYRVRFSFGAESRRMPTRGTYKEAESDLHLITRGWVYPL